MSICHVSFPEPMILPKQVYFLYGNLLCLGQEEEDEAAHDEYQAREQQKDSIFERDTRKHCAMRAVKIILTQTTMLCPADLVSRGNSSLGTSQPKGPQDLPYATTNMQIMTTRKMPIPFGSSSPSPNFKARVTATATCETNFQSRRISKQKITKTHIISTPASRKKALLPNLSTKAIEMNVARTSAPLVIADEYNDAPEPNPKL
uniref:Uncharacterized protein n=1 Tax=Solanum lycopersicum TaxID=4081 RepID=A0A3Q7HB23_SOLLC